MKFALPGIGNLQTLGLGVEKQRKTCQNVQILGASVYAPALIPPTGYTYITGNIISSIGDKIPNLHF